MVHANCMKKNMDFVTSFIFQMYYLSSITSDLEEHDALQRAINNFSDAIDVYAYVYI